MTRTAISRDRLDHLLKEAVIGHHHRSFQPGEILALSSLSVTKLPALDPRAREGANWHWSCPGASRHLDAALLAEAEQLGRQYDLV